MTLSPPSAGSAFALGVRGLQGAARLHEQAAHAVQRSFDEPTQEAASASHPAEPAARLELSASVPGRSTAAGAAPSLAGAMTDMMKAGALQSANVMVLETANETSRELLDIVG